MHERCGDMQFKMLLKRFRLPVFSSVVEELTVAVDMPDLGALPEKERLESTIKSPVVWKPITVPLIQDLAMEQKKV